MKNLVIANTKGGVGKTNISLNILPSLLKTDKNTITYYQLDNNNKIDVTSDNINIKQFKLNNLEEALTEVEFSAEDVNIIDCGGGDDTIKVLEELKNCVLEDLKFIIPINKNLSIRHNIEETIRIIKDNFDNPEIYLCFNFLDKDKDLKKEYINIFGDEIFDIKPISLAEFQADSCYVLNTNLFQILELKNMILIDSYIELFSLVKNKEKLSKKQKEELHKKIKNGEITKEEGQKEYLILRNKIRQAEKIVNLVNELREANKDFIKALGVKNG